MITNGYLCTIYLILSQAAGICEVIDPALKDKIAELIGMSVRRVSDVKRYLEQYVMNELFKDMALPPKTRYFPRKKDIANEIAKIKREKKFTQIDQDYLHHLISSWKVQKPDDMFFFRPHTTQDVPNQTQNTESNSEGDDDDIEDDIDAIQATRSSAQNHNLLFCYQSKEQRCLLSRYGNMCLLDATYRTTRYALPLFFLCVKTNVGYQVVGVFVIQQEDINSIKEALDILRGWNPEWMPKNFMVDFADEEIQAIEATFPGKIHYLSVTFGINITLKIL